MKISMSHQIIFKIFILKCLEAIFFFPIDGGHPWGFTFCNSFFLWDSYIVRKKEMSTRLFLVLIHFPISNRKCFIYFNCLSDLKTFCWRMLQKIKFSPISCVTKKSGKHTLGASLRCANRSGRIICVIIRASSSSQFLLHNILQINCSCRFVDYWMQ